MMYYNQNSLNMGGSFQQKPGVQNSFHQGQPMNGSRVAKGSTSGSHIGSQARPFSSYNNKAMQNNKKKSNISDVGSSGGAHSKAMDSLNNVRMSGGGNTHVINQSLKPKMIMNNNTSYAQQKQHNSSTTRAAPVMQQHMGNSGDFQVSNTSMTNNFSGGRPMSSKPVQQKKKGQSNPLMGQQMLGQPQSVANMPNPSTLNQFHSSFNQNFQ